MSPTPLAVTVNMVDSLAGEGIAADAAVLAELQCRPLCVASAVMGPARGPSAIEPLPLELVRAQLDAALAVGRTGAARIGLVRGEGHVELVADRLGHAAPALVAAPVLRVGGAEVLDAASFEATVRLLVPVARVLVVHAADLAAFVGPGAADLDAAREGAARLRGRGASAVLISGIFARGRVIDLLDDGGTTVVLDAARVHAPHVPGIAGAHAAALTAHLAQGLDLARAAEAAQRYVGLRLARRW